MSQAADQDPTPALGGFLDVLRGSGALSQADLMRITGQARNTVRQRLEVLLDAGLVTSSTGDSTGGRPALLYRFDAGRGVLLVCDVGATGFRAARCDLGGTVLDDLAVPGDVADGPQAVLGRVGAAFGELLGRAGLDRGHVLGVGLDVPGPVDVATGRVVSPPIMTGWDGYDIPGWFAAGGYDAPVVVDKDANAMAVGERRQGRPGVNNLMFVKIGTGVGAGFLSDGRVHRGADGAAGDIGHIQIREADDADPPVCRCGNVGCVEAYAGGWALLRDLSAAGRDVHSIDEVVALVRQGDVLAQQLLRRGGRMVGHAVADAVNMINPSLIAVGGQLAAADDQLLAGLREIVYRRSLPLATRRLQIVRAAGGERVGVIGMAGLVAAEVFSPHRLGRLVAG